MNHMRSAVAVLGSAALLLASCAGAPFRWTPSPEATALLAGPRPAHPVARFAVISDLHFYDAAVLGTEGEAFAEEIKNDRKLVIESAEILGEALRMVRASGAKFLIVPGDLTWNGERVNHEGVAAMLADLERSGVQVYLVPGNHDVLNPHAAGFGPEGRKAVPGVTPGEFAEIYRDFGYGEALRRDPASLSYVAEPVPGLWLLGIDSCRYAENTPKDGPVTGGRLDPGRIAWVEAVLADALRLGKTVTVFMHHGLVEHFRDQEKSWPDYLVEDYPEIARMLAAYGVRVAFTGHYHAQDAALARFPDGSFLFDVMTGSLATAPNVRLVAVDASGSMSIQSEPVASLPSFAATGVDFASFARTYVHERIAGIAVNKMRKMHVPVRDTAALAPQIADAFLANYWGDERFTGTERLSKKGLSLMGRIVVGIQKNKIEPLWDDLEPADNNLVIDLATGSWRAGD
ncbi:MAG: metallophosphoesterase [Spirochaetes bacterium]|nr:metallophosphoesterase [Spirochaetota bacterium]